MKSVFFNYEHEVCFVCAANFGFMHKGGGVLIPVNAANFAQHVDYSPHFHNKEKSATKRVVESLRSARHKVHREPLVESDTFWNTSLIEHASSSIPSPDYCKSILQSRCLAT
jgi:hypothetical protein